MSKTERNVMLTTIDNPYNPFTHYDEWFNYDSAKGYDTPNYLARMTDYSMALGDPDIEMLTNFAIDDIVELNVLNIYRKVTAESWFLEDAGVYETRLEVIE